MTQLLIAVDSVNWTAVTCPINCKTVIFDRRALHAGHQPSKENALRTITLAILLAAGLAAQDKITITVTRGTVTRTAEIPTAAAAEAYKALDFYAASQAPRSLNETTALHELVASMLLGQLRVTPSTAVKAAVDAEAAALSALRKAESDFLKAAGAPAQ